MSATDPSAMHVTGQILLDDDRDVGDMWVRDGVISFMKPSAVPSQVVEIEGWVLPGLVDVHCHIGLGPQGSVSAEVARAQALADRNSGVLLVRDAGSPSDTSWLSADASLPRVIRSGRHVARPQRYLQHYGVELDDIAALPAVVGAQARESDGWVKLVGDWIDRSLGDDGDLRPLWPEGLLVQAVQAAHDEAARVMVHTFAEETIPSLLAAGVDCIEHGTGITVDQMADVAARGIAVTPTLIQIGNFQAFADQGEAKFPVFARRMRQLHARRYDQVRALYEAGVMLLVGTDAGGQLSHGLVVEECRELVKAGIPVPDVVAAASWRARQFLGYPTLVEGASADFVVYPEDPRTQVEVLAHPTAVVLRGRRVA